jgi:hypothetical protein
MRMVSLRFVILKIEHLCAFNFNILARNCDLLLVTFRLEDAYL